MYNPPVPKKCILSISYDHPLLVTRQLMLEQQGYEVVSAFGFAEAMEICSKRSDFDLVLMGHSMPQKDKTSLFEVLRPDLKAPLLSIVGNGESPIPQAIYSVKADDGPAALVEAVRAVLESGRSRSAD